MQPTLPMHGQVQDLKQALSEHPLYAALEQRGALQVFCERHVACVFDFMSLLKSLQRDLTGMGQPWLPPSDPEAAWLINSIVVDEEGDLLPDGRRLSHFEWYLEAMEELGADTRPMQSLLADLRRGTRPEVAIQRHGLPLEARQFLASTFAVLQDPLHIRAAVFFHGREDVIPKMFLPMTQRLAQSGLPCSLLVAYLERHIETDAGVHGPKATALLERLFAGRADLRSEAEQAACKALEARKQLWDTVAEGLALQV